MRILVAYLIIFSLVSLSLPAAFAQEKLSIEIKADKSTFLLGEPVILYISLKNSDMTSSEVVPLEPEYGFAEYMIKGPNRLEKRFLPWSYRELADPRKLLAPGEEMTAFSKIFYGSDGWTFKTPGAYEIWMVYQGNLSSNRLTLDIMKATDQANLTAGDLFLGSDEVGKFLLFEGGDHLKDGIGRINQVTSQFPDTPHAAYANYALGKNMMSDFANFVENRLRPANPKLAAQYLEKEEMAQVGFYYTIQTYLTLSEAYKETGNITLSESMKTKLNRTTLERFKQSIPILKQSLALNRTTTE